jgi:hypothetical protein
MRTASVNPAPPGLRAGVRGCSRSEESPENVNTAPFRGPWWIGKPGSVVERHSSGMDVATHLVRPTRWLGRVSPRRLRGAPAYLVLLPGGFAMPVLLPVRRWALTPPFRPYLIRSVFPQAGHRRFVFCCTFRRVAPPWCYQAQYPAEPGLSSALADSDALIHRPSLARAQPLHATSATFVPGRSPSISSSTRVGALKGRSGCTLRTMRPRWARTTAFHDSPT